MVFNYLSGQGSYASVKLALESGSNTPYAVKIYDKYKLLDPHKLNNVKREIIILRKIDHPHIIKFFYALEDKRQIHLVMEYVGNTSLNNYIKMKQGRRLDERESKRIFAQLVKGVYYCHSKNIVHRDIKLENILLDEKLNVKLIDFGFSIIKMPSKKLNIFCGTPSYMAPEIVSKSQYSGPEADIWALGIVLFLMLCGYFPFKGFNIHHN
jgi:serine/threonine protein kinase